MANVIVIRKQDRTIHKSPLANKAFLQAYNNKLPENQKFGIEEMGEEEASKLPYIDESYVTAGEAQKKAAQLEGTVSEQAQLIEQLKAQIAAAGTGGTGNHVQLNAVDTIAKIKSATTKEEVLTILGNDERKTVKDAADEMIASFETK